MGFNMIDILVLYRCGGFYAGDNEVKTFAQLSNGKQNRFLHVPTTRERLETWRKNQQNNPPIQLWWGAEGIVPIYTESTPITAIHNPT